MAVLLETLLGIPFWLLGLFRVIRISGYWRTMNFVRRGRVLIVANHPSLIETFLIPLVFWPWAMFRLRMFPWSLPDKNLFKGFTPEHHERLRCIRVGRDDTLESRKLNWSAMKRVMEHFERQQCFVAHLEGGRTSKQAERVSVGPNKMGKIKNAQVLKAAWKKGAWIVPLHVRMKDDMSGICRDSARACGACSSVRNPGRSGSSFAVPTRSSDRGSTKKQKRDVWNWRFSHPRCRHDLSA